MLFLPNVLFLCIKKGKVVIESKEITALGVIMEIVKSLNGIPIRLTDERWLHITEQHSEMSGYYYEVLDAINDPEAVYQGSAEEMIATKEIEPGKNLVVVYKELNKDDGFIITAFLTRKIKQFERRIKLWPQ